MIVLKSILSDHRKALVFARHVLAETAWLVVPVALVVVLGRGTLLVSLAIAAIGLAVGLILAMPLRLLVIEQELRRRNRTAAQLAAMDPKEFAAEITRGWGFFGGQSRPK